MAAGASPLPRPERLDLPSGKPAPIPENPICVRSFTHATDRDFTAGTASGAELLCDMSVQAEEFSVDPLFDVELEIARRADALARGARNGSALNLHCWLIAEAEVLGSPPEKISGEPRLAL